VQRDKLKVEKALLSKGFRKDNTHHRVLIYWTQNEKKTTVRTKTSHGTGTKTLGDSLLKKMADQCRLDKPEFLELVDCSMDQVVYEKRLAQNGLV
jgi:hypothetical protein